MLKKKSRTADSNLRKARGLYGFTNDPRTANDPEMEFSGQRINVKIAFI